MSLLQLKAYCQRKANGPDPRNAYLNAWRRLDWSSPARVTSDLLASASHNAKMQVEGQPLPDIIECYRLQYEAFIDLLQRLGVQDARARTAYTKKAPVAKMLRPAGRSRHARTRHSTKEGA